MCRTAVVRPFILPRRLTPGKGTHVVLVPDHMRVDRRLGSGCALLGLGASRKNETIASRGARDAPAGQVGHAPTGITKVNMLVAVVGVQAGIVANVGKMHGEGLRVGLTIGFGLHRNGRVGTRDDDPRDGAYEYEPGEPGVSRVDFHSRLPRLCLPNDM